jgi:hypothetical protein
MIHDDCDDGESVDVPSMVDNTKTACNLGSQFAYSLRTHLKIKLSTTRHGGAWGDRKYSSYSFLTSALDEVSGQRHARPRFSPGERTPGTHCTGGWVGGQRG